MRALLGVLEEFTGFSVLCLAGRIVRREAEILSGQRPARLLRDIYKRHALLVPRKIAAQSFTFASHNPFTKYSSQRLGEASLVQQSGV